MLETVVSDFMARIRDLCKVLMVFFQRRVLANNKEGYFQIPICKEPKYARNNDIQIGREVLPIGIAMSLHIGPLIVKVEG